MTNERSRYSVLVRIPGKDPKALLTAVHSAMMRAFDRYRVLRPGKVELSVQTLSGAARSLTSFQNQLMYHLDNLVERQDFEFLDDLERPLNHTPTKILKVGGQGYVFPDDAFPKICKEDPPFDSGAGGEPDNVVAFLN